MSTVHVDRRGPVAEVVLANGGRMITIDEALRDGLNAALDTVEADRGVRVILLRAEGPAFCAGFGLDWSTAAQGEEEEGTWDSVADLEWISSYADTWRRLSGGRLPVVAAVHGWCIAGGTDMVLHADLIIAGESAVFGYPPARVWGTPEAPWVWIARLGLERAKRYLLTGDEIPAADAAAMGMVLETVADAALLDRARALADRMALLPRTQLVMLKRLCNDVAEQIYAPPRSQLLGSLFDGVARHTGEGRDFVAVAETDGWKEAVRRRDAPFGDYGARRASAAPPTAAN